MHKKGFIVNVQASNHVKQSDQNSGGPGPVSGQQGGGPGSGQQGGGPGSGRQGGGPGSGRQGGGPGSGRQAGVKNRAPGGTRKQGESEVSDQG